MRVAFVVPSISRLGGGVSEVARLNAQALSEVPGFEVEVFTVTDEHFEADARAWGGIPIHAFRHYGPVNYGFSPRLAWHLSRSKADVVHVHGIWMFHCFATLLWSAARKGRYVVTPHGMFEPWILARSAAKKRLLSRLYQNRFLQKASVIQLLTAKEGHDVAGACGDLPARVIPNYVPSIASAPASAAPAWFRPEYKERDIYLFFGRIHEKKGCLELLEAWDEQCRSNPSFRDKSVLVYCGWIDGMPDFASRVEEVAARHHNVIYAGAQYGEDKQRSFAAATFFVLPSKSEGLPMAILEAWRAGVIVLMTENCNLPVGFEKKAALCIGTSVGEIREGLDDATHLSLPARNAMRHAGQELIEEQFSKVVVTNQFVELYQSVVGPGK